MGSKLTVPPPVGAAAGDSCTVYYLVWRTRPTQPWRSEEFSNRIAAHQRYFTLLDRGAEAYLERRRQGYLPA